MIKLKSRMWKLTGNRCGDTEDDDGKKKELLR